MKNRNTGKMGKMGKTKLSFMIQSSKYHSIHTFKDTNSCNLYPRGNNSCHTIRNINVYKIIDFCRQIVF